MADFTAAITEAPIDTAALLAQVSDPDHGAVLLFVGTVRQTNDGRRVTGIEYEAYREMAEGVLGEIVSEAVTRVGGARIAAVHRIGALDLGEASVAIAVSTGHRAEAFDASRYIIEEIKTRLPVWKREAYVEGDQVWLDGQTPVAQEAAHE